MGRLLRTCLGALPSCVQTSCVIGSFYPPQLVGALVGLLALIAIGVGVGVSVSNKNRTKNNGNSSNNNSNNNNGNSSDPVTQSDPNDPSTFQKDPRLKQSFYGIAYEPNGVIYPTCGATLQDVIVDIQLMSQLTKVNIRSPALRLSDVRWSLLHVTGGYFWLIEAPQNSTASLHTLFTFPLTFHAAHPDLWWGLRPFAPRP